MPPKTKPETTETKATKAEAPKAEAKATKKEDAPDVNKVGEFMTAPLTMLSSPPQGLRVLRDRGIVVEHFLLLSTKRDMATVISISKQNRVRRVPISVLQVVLSGPGAELNEALFT